MQLGERKYFTHKGQNYCLYQGQIYEIASAGGCLVYVHYPSTRLREYAAKYGFTQTIEERMSGNIHVYGNQSGARAHKPQTANHKY